MAQLNTEELRVMARLNSCRRGVSYESEHHDDLIARGLLELEPWGEEPDHVDVRLTRAGLVELGRLHALGRQPEKPSKIHIPQPGRPLFEQPRGFTRKGINP